MRQKLQCPHINKCYLSTYYQPDFMPDTTNPAMNKMVATLMLLGCGIQQLINWAKGYKEHINKTPTQKQFSLAGEVRLGFPILYKALKWTLQNKITNIATAPVYTSEEVRRDISASPSLLSLSGGNTGILGGTILHFSIQSTAEHLVSIVPATQIQQHTYTPVTVTIKFPLATFKHSGEAARLHWEPLPFRAFFLHLNNTSTSELI